MDFELEVRLTIVLSKCILKLIDTIRKQKQQVHTLILLHTFRRIFYYRYRYVMSA